jgi:uncharacterized protein YutE (UPF0331/DUF86 family)
MTSSSAVCRGADLWRRVIGFRNVIVHDYLDVDRAIMYDIVRNRLGDLRELQRAILTAQRGT